MGQAPAELNQVYETYPG